MAIKLFCKKNAQLFSLIALMMSVFFIILFSGVSRVPLDKDVERTQAEIRNLNGVVEDISSLVGSAAESSAYLSINFTTDPAYMNGNYYADYRAAFDSCFRRGMLEDIVTTLDVPCNAFGKNSSFIYLLNETLNLTSKIHNISIVAYDHDYTLDFIDPYAFDLRASVRVNITRDWGGQRLFWTREIIVNREILLIGMIDPYSIGTHYERTIKPYPGERTWSRPSFKGVVTSVPDPSIEKFIDEGYYFVDVSGADIIQRLEGQTISDLNLENVFSNFGLASFVPPDSPAVNERSYIDNHYFFGAVVANSNLRYFTEPGINNDITIQFDYVEQGLEVSKADLATPP